jgi:hypothetical protein
VACHEDINTSDLAPCYAAAGAAFQDSEDVLYTSNDLLCLGQGTVTLEGIPIGGYCTLFTTPGCSLVWGLADSFGTSPIHRFRGSQVHSFLRQAAGRCGNDGGLVSVVRTAAEDPNRAPGGWSLSFCLVHDGQEDGCGTNQGFPLP